MRPLLNPSLLSPSAWVAGPFVDRVAFFLDPRREQEPSGYLNVLKIREAHVSPRDTSAVDTLMALTPLEADG